VFIKTDLYFNEFYLYYERDYNMLVTKKKKNKITITCIYFIFENIWFPKNDHIRMDYKNIIRFPSYMLMKICYSLVNFIMYINRLSFVLRLAGLYSYYAISTI